MRTISAKECVTRRLVTGVVEGGGKLSGQAELFVQLPDRQQAGVAGQLSLLRLDDDGLMIEEIE